MSREYVMPHFLNKLQNHIEDKLAHKAHIYWPFIIELTDQKYLCTVDTRQLFMVLSLFGDLRTAEKMVARDKENRDRKSILQ